MRSHHHGSFPVERIRAERTASATVCLPTREEAATVGPIVESLVSLRSSGVVDQVLVVDAGSSDGTAEIAARAGAEVHDQSTLLPEIGPVLGKGDALWRALTVATGDVVCFLDADSEDFGPHFACGVLGPLLCEDGVDYVKAFYRRPFKLGSVAVPEGGGRVTELTARPLLKMLYPELAAVRQPLAGEMAARRSLLERLPFVTGYGVEVAMLIDAYRAVGLDAMAQVDLEVRQNRHQPLRDLGPMADAVLAAVTDRLVREGRLDPAEAGRAAELVERPPLASLRAAA